MNNYYITTPIYYVNDSPHIGHAYTTLACDVIARFKRLDGYNVMFLTGTDEHGQKIARSADAKGMNPQQFVDQVSQKFRHLVEVMKFSNDDFIRTSEPRHKKVVQQIWKKLMDNGQIYLSKYAGWYAVRDEAFYSEEELIDGKAPTGAEVQWVEEESYFFRLSEWQEKLLSFYESNPDFIAPNSRRNEVISFVKSGLHDLSISRTTFSWGVPVPGDDKHVIYVWLDALVNYISAVEWPENHLNLWPADLHMVGKDILRFHAVYWPAFLMAADIPLPKRIFAHGWWTNEGQKISKSLGNVIDPLSLVSEFGLDYVRYFLMREMPFGNDGNYSRHSFIERVNAELANNVGNLAQRVLSFVIKNCAGNVEAPKVFSEADRALLVQAYNSIGKIRLEIERQAIHNALGIIIELSTKANEYITLNAPWELNKTDKERMHVVLYTLLEVIRVISILLQPIMPDAAQKLLDQLNVNERRFTAINEGLAPPCFEISAVNIIFPRLQQ
jgi:methionyl-tRNA synthetase